MIWFLCLLQPKPRDYKRRSCSNEKKTVDKRDYSVHRSIVTKRSLHIAKNTKFFCVFADLFLTRSLLTSRLKIVVKMLLLIQNSHDKIVSSSTLHMTQSVFYFAYFLQVKGSLIKVKLSVAIAHLLTPDLVAGTGDSYHFRRKLNSD